MPAIRGVMRGRPVAEVTFNQEEMARSNVRAVRPVAVAEYPFTRRLIILYYSYLAEDARVHHITT